MHIIKAREILNEYSSSKAVLHYLEYNLSSTLKKMKTITSVVLTIVVAYVAGSQHLYKMDFEENGSHYDERIIVNEEKEYLIYDVPKHNGIQAARFLKDFKARLNVLLDLVQKVCYISDMKSDEPTPDSVEDGLKMVHGHFPKKKFIVNNEQIFPGPKIADEKLPLIVKKFCQGMKKLSVVHKSSKEMEKILKEKLLGTYNKQPKRETYRHEIINYGEYQICDDVKGTMKDEMRLVQRCKRCKRPDLLKLNCDIKWKRYCNYSTSTVECEHSSPGRQRCSLPQHSITLSYCCRASCPLSPNCEMMI